MNFAKKTMKMEEYVKEDNYVSQSGRKYKNKKY